MWDFPGLGIEPVSPALAGIFFTNWAIREAIKLLVIYAINIILQFLATTLLFVTIYVASDKYT